MMGVLTEINWGLLLKRTYFRACKGSSVKLGEHTDICDSHIIIGPGSSIQIGNNVCIRNVNISIFEGKLTIDNNSIIGQKQKKISLNIEDGEIHIGHHSKISTSRIWVRFGGIVRIGNYTNINNGSEIRCDEKITIGNYNQISYNVNIWDTNTHCILPPSERRKIAEKYFPYFGKETSRPSTDPIVIGDDCWLGQGTTLLKGTTIGNEVIIGYGTTITGKLIPSNSTVVNDVKLKITQRPCSAKHTEL